MQSLQNTRRRPLSIAAAILPIVLALLLSLPISASSRQAPVKLTILHVNDTHGHIIPYVEKSVDPNHPVSGAEYFAKMVERARAENPEGTILLSAGDMFQGTPISNLFHGRPVIEIMNYLKYDAMVLGNHEFDWGQDVLRTMISEAAFPVLSANVFERNGKRFEGVKPYVILKRHNVRVGIIGLTTPEAFYTSKPGNLTGLSIAQPEKVTPGLIRQVRSKGADFIVVLSHLGLEADRELAKQVRGIDVIVGGHSHTVVRDPVNESGTIIVQAGSNGLYLGALDVTFDPSRKKILDYTRSSELKPVSGGPESPFDPDVARIVESYEVQVRAEFSKVVGKADVNLTRESNKESGFGDLIADAMREAADAQVAFQNPGGIRTDLSKGPITLEMIYTALPFDNLLVSMDLSGVQIKELLEKSALSEKVLQVSGLKVEFDTSKPAGSRVVAAEIGGKPLEPATDYKVATNDFLAAGGDQFNPFKNGKNVSFGVPVRDAVVDYIRRNSPIGARIQDRIIFVR